jgi:D-tyrosyl-tRNA(Tyr) deacylase
MSLSAWCVHAGNKPDFHKAMGSDRSKAFYEAFVEMVKSKYQADKIQGPLCATLFWPSCQLTHHPSSVSCSQHVRCADGQFGAMMEVELVNDGPVTLQIDSRDK